MDFWMKTIDQKTQPMDTGVGGSGSSDPGATMSKQFALELPLTNRSFSDALAVLTSSPAKDCYIHVNVHHGLSLYTDSLGVVQMELLLAPDFFIQFHVRGDCMLLVNVQDLARCNTLINDKDVDKVELKYNMDKEAADEFLC